MKLRYYLLMAADMNLFSTYSDEDLLPEVITGSAAVFAVLYERHN
jgi:hypothetical protein